MFFWLSMHVWFILAAVQLFWPYLVCNGYQVANEFQEKPFPAYDPGFVGVTLKPENYQREAVNEGSPHSPSVPLLYGDQIRAEQICPSMVGPLGDGLYYCGGKEYGYCDRRNGVCHCREGYAGLDCMDCAPSHYNNGSLCYPRILCPKDCSKRGQCNYFSGTCICDAFRTGPDCSQVICQLFDELCEECTEEGCVRCAAGYAVATTFSRVCYPCWNHDPRCVECNQNECLTCADPLLLSIRRSGRRLYDPPLPVEEFSRELSVVLGFGSQSIYAFKEAEPFRVVGPPGSNSLGNVSVECAQGTVMDASWDCQRFALSHVVCGHEGTLAFGSPTYSIGEQQTMIRISVVRTGGGVGNVEVEYSLEHVTTSAADVTATAPYTTNQTLLFQSGIVRISFLVFIHDNRVLQDPKTFRLRLMQPRGGARLGSQHIAVVTITDDDALLASHLLSYITGVQIATAGLTSNFTLHSKSASNISLKTGGFLWRGELQTFTPSNMSSYDPAFSQKRPRLPSNAYTVSFNDLLDGSYNVSWNTQYQGNYSFRIFLLTRGGLTGSYYEDEFFGHLRMQRVDTHVNFTWGYGRLTEFASDHVSIRWEGFLCPDLTGLYNISVVANDNARLWIGGALLIDAWNWGPGEALATVQLQSGFFHSLVLEYREKREVASVKLFWQAWGIKKDIIPSSNLFVQRELSRSPFNVTVLSAPSCAFTSLVFGPGLQNGTVGNKAELTIIPKDQFGNLRNDGDGYILAADIFQVKAQLISHDGLGQGVREIHAFGEYDFALSVWRFSYTPTVSGLYQANVTYKETRYSPEMHVLGSPFRVYFWPAKAFAPRCQLYGKGLTAGTAGYTQHFVIIARDVFNNYVWKGGEQFQVYAYSQVNLNAYVIGTVVDLNNGNYSASLVPQLDGNYWLAITLGGQHVWSSPYLMVVRFGDPTGNTSTVEQGVGWANATANLQNYFVIQARDAFSNKVLQNLFSIKAFLYVPVNISCSISMLGNGFVRISYVPQIAGLNRLRVILQGQDIIGSPFNISVREGPLNSSMSTAIGTFLHTSEAGVHATFSIQARDKTSNPLETGNSTVFMIKLTGADTQSGWVTYEGKGLYTGNYIAKVSGAYELIIYESHSGVQIKNSPFQLFVIPSYVDASRSLLVGGGLIGGIAGISEPINIQAVDRFGNNRTVGGDTFFLSVYLTAGLGNTSATDYQNGKYWVEYTPTISGNYTVNVTVFQPYGLWVNYYYMENFYKAVKTSINPNISYDWGIEAPISLLPTDFFSVQWNGYVKPPYSEEFTFFLTIDENSKAWLKVGGVLLVGSDNFSLPITEYTASYIFVGGQFYDFEVRYSHATENASISLEWASPTLPRQIVPSERIYRLLTVTDRIYNTTFNPAPVSPPNSTMVGSMLSGSNVGQNVFTVEARDQFGNLQLGGSQTVSVYARGPGTSSFVGAVNDNQNGTYTVTVNPTVAGYYTMTTIILSARPSIDLGYYNSEAIVSQYNIQNSPLVIFFTPSATVAATTTAFGQGLFHAVAGELASFFIQAKDVYSNFQTAPGDVFTVYINRVHSNMAPVHLQTMYVSNGLYNVEYNMTMSGDYVLSILLLESHIVGSPYALHITPNIAFAGNCVIFNVFTNSDGQLSTFQIHSKDYFGNILENGGDSYYSVLYGPERLFPSITDNGNGTYSAFFNYTKPGLHQLVVQLATKRVANVAGGGGLLMQGFNNRWFKDEPVVTQIDPYIDFSYGTGLMTPTAKDFVSVRWSGFIKAYMSQSFTFEVYTSLMVRLYIQDNLVLDSEFAPKGSALLVDNMLHKFVLEAQKSSQTSYLTLFWESFGTPKQVVPSFALFPGAFNISIMPVDLMLT